MNTVKEQKTNIPEQQEMNTVKEQKTNIPEQQEMNTVKEQKTNIPEQQKMNTVEEQKTNASYNYVEQRLKPQMNYYNVSCRKLQRRYHLFATAGIIVTSIIPIFALLPTDIGDIAQYITAGLSTVSSIIGGIVLFSRFKEQWLQYRVTYEKLESELAKYSAGSGAYHKLNSTEQLDHLVETCEKYMENEHNQWRQIMSKEK